MEDNIFTCAACHYTFTAATLPDSCPDCGKQLYRGAPAIRPATEEEIEEFKKNREIAEKEEW